MINDKSLDLKDDFTVEDNEDEDCFETIKGTVLGSFSFGDNLDLNKPILSEMQNNQPLQENPLEEADVVDYRRGSSPKTITPKIKEEKFLIKRGYQYRESTLRKLSILKANHPDINALLTPYNNIHITI